MSDMNTPHEFFVGLSQSETIVSTIVIFIVAVIVYYKYKFSYWSKYGVKQPTPWLVFGNSVQYFGKHRLMYELEWPRKLGKVYGYYLGTSARLVIADPDVVRDISIRDFHLFPNRFFAPYINEKYQRNFLTIKRDHEWKRLRSIITPTFTSGKMKRMFPLMEQCYDELEQSFDKLVQQNQQLDCKKIFGLYTMDIITRCCFGIKLEREKQFVNGDSSSNAKSTSDSNSVVSRDSFVTSARKILDVSIKRLVTSAVMPKQLLQWLKFEIFDPQAFEDIGDKATLIYKTRKSNLLDSDKSYDDYLQLLIDAKLMNDEHDGVMNDLNSTSSSTWSNQERQLKRDEPGERGHKAKINNKLSDNEIIANSMLFLFVGYETTGSLLSSCTYALAFHPQVQEKLYNELKQINECQSGRLNYDAVMSSVYLNCVVCETLRLMSPVITLDRVATQDYRVDKYGITIPAGTIVQLAFYAIQHDSDYWTKANEFDPNRFLPENKRQIYPNSYCAFGMGPRQCVGMRFALTEAKLALARLVLRYHFAPSPGAVFPPKPSPTFFLTKYQDLSVQLVTRDTPTG